MPRPVSWLPRLKEIRKAVEASVRSHWTRSELERLFQVQPRQAGRLMAAMDREATLGTTHLVTSAKLLSFLDRADSETLELAKLEAAGKVNRRRQLRVLIRQDEIPGSLESLPEGVTLEQGRFEIRFKTAEEFLARQMMVALALNSEAAVQVFEERFCPPKPPDPKIERDRQAMQALFADLRRREAEYQGRKPVANDTQTIARKQVAAESDSCDGYLESLTLRHKSTASARKG